MGYRIEEALKIVKKHFMDGSRITSKKLRELYPEKNTVYIQGIMCSMDSLSLKGVLNQNNDVDDKTGKWRKGYVVGNINTD